MSQQIVGYRGGRSTLQILWSGAEDPANGKQGSGDQIFRARRENLKRHVITLISGIDRFIANRDIQINERIFRAEILERPPEMAERKSWQDLKPKHSTWRALRQSHPVRHRIHMRDELGAFIEKFWPASESATLRVERWNRGIWTKLSSCLMRLVITEGVTPS